MAASDIKVRVTMTPLTDEEWEAVARDLAAGDKNAVFDRVWGHVTVHDPRTPLLPLPEKDTIASHELPRHMESTLG